MKPVRLGRVVPLSRIDFWSDFFGARYLSRGSVILYTLRDLRLLNRVAAAVRSAEKLIKISRQILRSHATMGRLSIHAVSLAVACSGTLDRIIICWWEPSFDAQAQFKKRPTTSCCNSERRCKNRERRREPGQVGQTL